MSANWYEILFSSPKSCILHKYSDYFVSIKSSCYNRVDNLKGGAKMAANLVDEIKAAEDKAAASVRDARAGAAKRLNSALTNAENLLKEAKQGAAKQFRENISAAEKKAEDNAREIVAGREATGKTFYAQHKDKVAKTAAWIAEEVTARYGRS